MDEAIKHLLSKQQDHDVDGGVEEPGKKRKIKVQEPLYTMEVLEERDGMVQHLTGFEPAQVHAIVKVLEEVSGNCQKFLVLLCDPSRSSSFTHASLLRQIIGDNAPDRRQSNEGHRAIDLPERVLIFLSRLWRKTPFKELAYQYGCGKESARTYFNELLDIFTTGFVPRLLYPPAA